MDTEPTEVNPYAAPVDAPRKKKKKKRRGRFAGRVVTWIFAAIALARTAPAAYSHVVALDAGTVKMINDVWTWGALVGSVVGVVWLALACGALPESAREDQRVSPLRAVTLLFVPCFNLYWIFAVNTRLCAALDAALERVGAPTRRLAPFGVLAAALHFVAGAVTLSSEPLIIMVAGVTSAIAWTAYMSAVDRGIVAFDARRRRRPLERA